MNAADVIRERVDAVRAEGKLDVHALLSSVSEIAGSAKHTGADLHTGGALHRCPWHTCQATRHN